MSIAQDRLWFAEYDEDAFHHSLLEVNFLKYLKNILTNSNFNSFQKVVQQEIHNQNQWNEKCWKIIQFYEFLNKAFSLEQFDNRLQFVGLPIERKTFGLFRTWIDLQRLYLLLFLKMDKAEFQNDRIYFSLFRFSKFFQSLLTEYHNEQFDKKFLNEIQKGILKHCNSFSDTFSQQYTILVKAICDLLPNYENRSQLVENNVNEQIQRNMFQKLKGISHSYHQVEDRLQGHVNFQNKFHEVKKLQSIFENQRLENELERVKKSYIPKIRIIQDFKDSCEKQKVAFDQDRLDELLQNYYNKQKGKGVSEHYYQTIQKNGHNPFQYTNYSIYGEILKIDLQKQLKFKEQPLMVETGNQEHEAELFFQDQQYIKRAENMMFSAAVSEKDFQGSATNERLPDEKKSKLSNMKWKIYNNEQQKKEKEMNPDILGLSNLQSLNQTKQLDNSALFNTFKSEEEEMKEKIQLLRVLGGGYRSQLLNNQKSKNSMISQEKKNSPLLDLNKKYIVDQNNFDKIRKVIQSFSVQEKINRWVYQTKIPKYYPRNMDEIREWKTNYLQKQQKINISIDKCYE